MILLATSAFDARSIGDRLGAPEYSYWFVRRAFVPLLARFGVVVPVTDPVREVPAIVANAAAHGETCVFLSFEPPHKTVLGLPCRTVPVFAWEFDSIPDESWESEPRHDWTRVLGETGSAITHSRFSVAAVRARMGADYPVWSIPAPVWSRHAPRAATARGWQAARQLAFDGIVIDAAEVDLDIFSTRRAHDEGFAALRALAEWSATATRDPRVITVEGVVYTVVYNPLDGRKNTSDLLAAFVAAFRDVADAMLILKITHSDPVKGLFPELMNIAKLGPFRCRLLLLAGMLPDEQYEAMLDVTSYTVNSSTNEGQCLPLMEFMSAGRPAIAPCHTAMLDYLSPENAFVVASSARPGVWPHDPRFALRTTRHVVSVADLVRQLRASYQIARDEPARYAAMSRSASAALASFCSDDVVSMRLREALAADTARDRRERAAA